MNSRYLPIGTIVTLRGEPIKIMVIGYYGQSPEGKITDYMGIMYPAGYEAADTIVGFNSPEIQEILFEGYNTPELAGLYNELDAFAQGLGGVQASETVPFDPNKARQELTGIEDIPGFEE